MDTDDIRGGAGNDLIMVSSDDYVYAGSGSDIISGDYYVFVSGEEGDDQISVISGEVYGDEGNDTITGLSLYAEGGDGNDTILISGDGTAEGGSGDDQITITAYLDNEFFISGGEDNDTINVNGSFGNINIGYYTGYGNDIVNNNLTSLDDIINISTNIQYSGVDIYLDISTAELIYSDPDRSEWKISSNIQLKYGDDILTLNNVYANVSSIGNGNISSGNVSGYESLNFSVSESLLYFSGYDQNVDYFVI